ncbi:MAG: hypothetical protein HZB80_08365 [Deltaproteobacteria bacterium]|nr:hypothetical protein [Deltaproteobacteria bacterium]
MKKSFRICLIMIYLFFSASALYAEDNEQVSANQPADAASKRWTLALSVGYEYDDNVLALPTELLKTTDVTTA